MYSTRLCFKFKVINKRTNYLINQLQALTFFIFSLMYFELYTGIANNKKLYARDTWLTISESLIWYSITRKVVVDTNVSPFFYVSVIHST
jgi:hypothetical protein